MIFVNFCTAFLRPTRCSMLAAIALAAWPVGATARDVPMITGRLLTSGVIQTALPVARTGDLKYAEVNSVWLKKFYDEYRAKLARLGVMKWDCRFDCRRFAGMFTELAQSEFFLEAFHDDIPMHTLALGPVWYQRADGKGGHAIIVAFTERGRIFLDPQTGKEVALTTMEQESIYLAVL